MADDSRRRYAMCGLSNRGLGLFALPLLGEVDDDYSSQGELVAVVDIDAERVARFNEEVGRQIPGYRPEEFDRMLDETHPDVILVTSPDHTHADYAVAALKHGLDVITEKPMAASCEQARAMLDAERVSAGTLRVAHNVRYTARNRLIKQMILDGRIGRVTSVDLLWSVDEIHGSSYFRRWNRQRALSGGLSIHKSCHHLDMVNWLIGDAPEQVFAYGALNYYGPASENNPSNRDGVDYSPLQQRSRDPYQRRLDQLGGGPADEAFVPRSGWRGLPYTAQYPPERPLYIYDEEIDIEDTYSAVVRYRGGASLSYALAFSGPWEGYRLGVNGTHGRIEAERVSFRLRGGETPESQHITYYPMFGERQVHDIPTGVGGHDGADPLIRRDLLLGETEESRRLSIVADAWQGAQAVAQGEAIWRSVKDNRPYSVAELLGER
jgi:predicted dehydrogenase